MRRWQTCSRCTQAALPIHVVPTAWMRDITGFNLHRGCLAVGERGPALVWRDLAAPARRLLVLEGVGNPDNVGGLFRTARAFGVDAVLIGPGTGDPLYRKAIRVSCGAALVLPWAEIAPWPDALDTLASLGIETWALTPGHDATPIGLAVASGLPQRLALIAGAEGPGLTAGCLARATGRVSIPIAASADSLNVTVAAGDRARGDGEEVVRVVRLWGCRVVGAEQGHLPTALQPHNPTTLHPQPYNRRTDFSTIPPCASLSLS